MTFRWRSKTAAGQKRKPERRPQGCSSGHWTGSAGDQTCGTTLVGLLSSRPTGHRPGSFGATVDISWRESINVQREAWPQRMQDDHKKTQNNHAEMKNTWKETLNPHKGKQKTTNHKTKKRHNITYNNIKTMEQINTCPQTWEKKNWEKDTKCLQNDLTDTGIDQNTKTAKNNSTNDYRDTKRLGVDTKQPQIQGQNERATAKKWQLTQIDPKDMQNNHKDTRNTNKGTQNDYRGRQSKQTPSIVYHAAYQPDHLLLLVYAGAMQSCSGTHILEVRGHADMQPACEHHSSPQSGMGRWWWIVFSRRCVCVCVHVAVTNCVLMILFTDHHPAQDGGGECWGIRAVPPSLLLCLNVAWVSEGSCDGRGS